MYLYRVFAGTFPQVQFGQDVGIFNDRFSQFLLYLLPKKTWSECVMAEMRPCSLGCIQPQNREAWRFEMRTLATYCYPDVRDTRSSYINSGSSQGRFGIQ